MYLITAASGNLIFPAEDELRGVSGLFYRLGINTAMDGIMLVFWIVLVLVTDLLAHSIVPPPELHTRSPRLRLN